MDVLDTLRIGLLVGLSLASFYTDLRYKEIFNWITYPAFIGGVVIAALQTRDYPSIMGMDQFWSPLMCSLGGALFCFGILILIWMQGGIGGADVKVMTAAGALAHFPWVVHLFMYTVLAGLALGLGMAIWNGKTKALIKKAFHPKELFKKHDLADSIQLVPLGVALPFGLLWAFLMTMDS